MPGVEHPDFVDMVDEMYNDDDAERHDREMYESYPEDESITCADPALMSLARDIADMKVDSTRDMSYSTKATEDTQVLLTDQQLLDKGELPALFVTLTSAPTKYEHLDRLLCQYHGRPEPKNNNNDKENRDRRSQLVADMDAYSEFQYYQFLAA